MKSYENSVYEGSQDLRYMLYCVCYASRESAIITTNFLAKVDSFPGRVVSNSDKVTGTHFHSSVFVPNALISAFSHLPQHKLGLKSFIH